MNNLNLNDLKAFNAELEKLNAYLDETQAKLALVYEGLCKIVELSKQINTPTYQPFQPLKWDWRAPITCEE